MAKEQSAIHATVRAVEGSEALVEVEGGGCGRCHENGGCGGQHLTQMFCNGPKSYRVDNPLGAGIGERVTVAVADGSVRRAANLAYGVPLVATVSGAFLGAQFGGDAGAVLGAVGCLVLSVAYIAFRSRGGAGRIGRRPYIVSRSGLSQES